MVTIMNPLPLLPMPVTDGLAYGVAAGSIVLGAALVAWGRFLGRPAMTLAVAAIGYVCGGLVTAAVASAWDVNLPAILAPMVLGLLGAGLGFLLERVWWGLLAGGVVAAGVLAFLLYVPPAAANHPTPHPLAEFTPSDPGTGAYLAEACAHFAKTFESHWSNESVTLALGGGIPLVLCLVLGIVRPRFVRILMNCLTGAFAVVFGVVLALSQMLGWMWEWNWRQWFVPVAVIVIAALAGVVMQERICLKEDALERKREEAARDSARKAKEKADRIAN